MNKYNLFYDKNTGQYFYQENENSEQIELNPLNKLDEKQEKNIQKKVTFILNG